MHDRYSRLNFYPYVIKFSQSVSQSFSQMKKLVAKNCSSTKLREKAYVAFVRPILQYARSVRELYTKKHMDKI